MKKIIDKGSGSCSNDHMLAVVSSGTLQGIEAVPVQVEVNARERGELSTSLVGLPDAAVKESINRVFSALVNSGMAKPQSHTTVNLAPGDIRKEGPLYDLPIALGILASTLQMHTERLGDFVIAGELGLSGKVRPVKGALALAAMARNQGKKGIILPAESAREAALVSGINVYPVDSLFEARQFLEHNSRLQPLQSPLEQMQDSALSTYGIDFSEVKGQYGVRRAVEVAIAGGHNLLMIGPPGSGKSMVAKRIPTIIPRPSLEEFLEILRIQSVAGITIKQDGIQFRRPFRHPHHTISDVGLLGGGVKYTNKCRINIKKRKICLI